MRGVLSLSRMLIQLGYLVRIRHGYPYPDLSLVVPYHCFNADLLPVQPEQFLSLTDALRAP